MGIIPNNTPDERATYKIKRSPSAESEEFLKVDISIRGGTSYLPSEARRIHTPPLPGESSDGRRRGFFFDYTAPKSRTASEIAEEVSRIVNRSPTVRQPLRRGTSTTTTISRAYGGKGKQNGRVKTGDWYDVQLAEIDLDDDLDMEDRSGGTKDESQLGGRSVSGSSVHAVLRMREEERMDYDIPEHFPSSPLCPRHPRYWRVVRGKGSQYRGCWMHGVGVFENGEELGRRIAMAGMQGMAARACY